MLLERSVTEIANSSHMEARPTLEEALRVGPAIGEEVVGGLPHHTVLLHQAAVELSLRGLVGQGEDKCHTASYKCLLDL